MDHRDYPRQLTLHDDLIGGGSYAVSLVVQDMVTLKGIALTAQIDDRPYVALALDPPGVCLVGADVKEAVQCLMRYKQRLHHLWIERGRSEHLDLSLVALCRAWALETERETGSPYLLLQETTHVHGTLGAYTPQHMAAFFLLLFRQITLDIQVQVAGSSTTPTTHPSYRPNARWN